VTDAPLTLIRNADLYAPGRIGRRHIVVAGSRIVWVSDDPPSLRGIAAEFDAAGRRVIPGIVDAHVHVTGGGGEAGAHTRVPPVGLSRFTRGGVTSVVGLLGTDDVTRSTAELVATVNGLRNEGLSAWCWTGGYHLPPATLTGTVRGDIALIDAVIGVGEVALSDHRSSQPTLEELARLASEAHVGGLMSGKAGVVHLHLGDGERGLELVRAVLDTIEIAPRVFHPTHVNRKKALFDEACALTQRGCTIDLTAFPVAEGEDAWPADVALTRYLEAGFPADRITVSSDAGGCLPVFDAEGRVASFEVGSAGALARTLRRLVRSGHPLERVLPAFTSNVAGLLRLARKGRIEPGCDADLVVLDEQGGIADVMARGRWHVLDGRAVLSGTFEKADDR
jgi:beta-aspartyl-dipeptidase (metallo-type)